LEKNDPATLRIQKLGKKTDDITIEREIKRGGAKKKGP